MSLLLDSNVLLWWLQDHPRLGKAAREMIVTSAAVYVSAASTWEITIKSALGKLKVSFNLEEEISSNRFLPLAITFRHSIAAASLPRYHDDPFDRMLVAQATLESLTLLTSDARLKHYGTHVRVV